MFTCPFSSFFISCLVLILGFLNWNERWFNNDDRDSSQIINSIIDSLSLNHQSWQFEQWKFLNRFLDQDNIFLKREIKCRNIRKTIPFRQRSVSPEIPHETTPIKTTDSVSIKYPKNWTEYKEMNLNAEKDSDLKLKLFKKSKNAKFKWVLKVSWIALSLFETYFHIFSFKAYLNFETPSVPIENFTVKFKSGSTRTVPYSHLRLVDCPN